jgi:hypothetical protein
MGTRFPDDARENDGSRNDPAWLGPIVKVIYQGVARFI